MNWDDVRYFLQLSRAGSLSEASRSMAVEHTTIARRVAALESSLGARLFDRLPRGWRLTEAGRELLPLAESLEGSAALLERRVTAGVGGTVRIATAPVVATHFIAGHLPPFFALHPAINVEVGTASGSANLLRGDADLALRIGSREVPPGLVVRELARVGYGLYAAPRYLERAGDSRDFIGFDESMRGTAQKQWLDAHATGARIVLRSNDLLVHHQAARAGVGIAFLPHFLVAPEDGLAVLASPAAPFERPLALLFRPGARRAKSIAAVMSFLIELVKREASFLASPGVPAWRAPGRTAASPARRRARAK